MKKILFMARNLNPNVMWIIFPLSEIVIGLESNHYQSICGLNGLVYAGRFVVINVVDRLIYPLLMGIMMAIGGLSLLNNYLIIFYLLRRKSLMNTTRWLCVQQLSQYTTALTKDPLAISMIRYYRGPLIISALNAVASGKSLFSYTKFLGFILILCWLRASFSFLLHVFYYVAYKLIVLLPML